MADNAPARRHYIVPADESGQFNRAYALELLADLESVLAAVGGTIIIAAQRTAYDRLGDSPVAFTSKLVIEWRAHSTLPLLGTGEPDPPAPDPEPEELDDGIDGLMPEELDDHPLAATGG